VRRGGVFGLAVLVLMVLLPLDGIGGQAPASPVFPEDRRSELMEDLDYSKPYEEPEEETAEDFEWPDWLKFPDFADWSFDVTDAPALTILALLLAGLGYFIYRMLGDVNLRKRAAGRGDEEDPINIADLEEEQLVAEGISLTMLERAERNGNFDGAVRLLYIQLLKELQDAELIKYRRDFSNRDYQRQLRDTTFLGDFRDVTADYERYWYGKYLIDRLSYRLVRRKFSTLNADVRATITKPDAYA